MKSYLIIPKRVHLYNLKKNNRNVLRYAEKFKQTIISETGDTYYFQNTKEVFDKGKARLLRSVLPVF